jgi:hypothetical protein
MKKKVLLSLVLLTIIGTGAVFAQQQTLDKLKFSVAIGRVTASAANNSISGVVVIPATYQGNPVLTVSGFSNITRITSVSIPNGVTTIFQSAFSGCTGITSITIPASVTAIQDLAFRDCTNLTSVTLQGTFNSIHNGSFPGDLVAKQRAGGAGTYTRPAGSNTWTKQGGFTLNGVWSRSDGMQITISADGQTITITGNLPNNGGRLNQTYTRR